VKYLVRDKVVEYLTPVVAECKNKVEAQTKIKDRLDELSRLATKILNEHGYEYQGKAILKRESFPTRVYDDCTLTSGVYDALIVELGRAEGDNWWCVIYPPLCFAGGNLTAKNIVYKSKILEIIREWKQTNRAGTR
jgi:stage II sporulation protein R